MIRLRRRMASLITAFAMTLSMLGMLPEGILRAAALSRYAVTVAGVQVTSENCDDILGNGEASFDHDSMTLNLYKDIIAENANGIEHNIRGLRIIVNNDVTVKGYNYGLNLQYSTTISGSGKLTVLSDNIGIGVFNLTTLTINDMTVEVRGKNYGIAGENTSTGVEIPGMISERLVIDDSDVTAAGEKGAICRIKNEIVLSGSVIDSPADAEYRNSSIYESDLTTLAKEVSIIKDLIYNFKVAGVQATPKNCKDILGHGEACYDPKTKTLELNGDIIPTADRNGILNYVDGLTIKVNKDVTVRATEELRDALQLRGDTTITGRGKLTAESTYSAGILVIEADLTIDSASVDVKGRWGIKALPKDEKLTIRNSEINADSTDGAICDFVFGGLTLEGCKIVSPNGGINLNGSIYNSNGTVKATQAKISYEKYDLSVGGIQVSGRNCSDILGSGNKEAVYVPSTKTLLLNGSISAGDAPAVFSTVDGLTVRVNKDLTLESTTVNTFCPYGNTTITGPGKLTVKSRDELAINNAGATLTIKDANVALFGKMGVCGSGSGSRLKVNNSTLTASADIFGVGYLGGIDLTGCKIIRPAGGTAYYDSTAKAWYIGDGRSSAEEVEIVPYEEYDLNIAGIRVTNLNKDDVLGNGKKEAVYDPATKTLELNASIFRSDAPAVFSEIDGLTVKVNKNLVLRSVSVNAFCPYGDTTITGPGKLNVASNREVAINVGDSTLTIKDANVALKGTIGICGGGNGSKLVIDNSNVYAESEYNGIGYLDGITLTDCRVSQPSGSYVYYDSNAKSYYIGNGSAPSPEVTIEPYKLYDLYVGDCQVDTLNKDDILENSSASYDPGTNTLELNGNIGSPRAEFGIRSYISGLTVKVNKDVLVRGSQAAARFQGYTVITGPGKLTLISGKTSALLLSTYDLTIKDADVVLNAKYGVSGYHGTEMLNINNSAVEARSTAAAFNNLTELNLIGCHIAEPEGGINFGGTVYNSDGTTVAAAAKIIPGEADIPDLGTLTLDLSSGSYTFASRNDYFRFLCAVAVLGDESIVGYETVSDSPRGVKLDLDNDKNFDIFVKSDLAPADLSDMITVLDTCSVTGIEIILLPADSMKETTVQMATLIPGFSAAEGCYSGLAFDLAGKPFKKGDVNRDGVVDLSDYSDLAKYFAEWTGFDEIVDVRAADLNNSGAPDLEDLSILAKYFAEWPGYEETYFD